MHMDALLNPKSVAVIGASADPRKTSGRPVSYLIKHGFAGDIYPVNPKATEIQGLKCYQSINDIPAAPDVALVLLGAKRSIDAVRELSQLGCKAAIVLASGFAEAGQDGLDMQQQLLDAAGDMRILGPNTIGLINLTNKIPLSASGALEVSDLPVGNIAVVSQSGGVLGALLSRAAGKGIGLSSLVSTSNEVDLEVADFVEHLVDDKDTKVIALYLESIRNPERFREAALKASLAGKPIVAFKIGRSEAGARAASSHTGALAGEDRVYDAFFKQLGVIRANTFDELIDIPAALCNDRKMLGRRVAILTSTGGAGTLVSDALGMVDFETPVPDEETAMLLRDIQGDTPTVLDRNPIDVTLAGLQPDLLRKAITILLDSKSYDALVVIIGSSGLAMPDLVVGAIQDCLPNSNKPVMTYVSPNAPDTLKRLNSAHIPSFTSPESCSAALEALYRTRPEALELLSAQGSKEVALRAPFETSVFDEAQAKSLFAAAGIPVPAHKIVHNEAEAEAALNELNAPVVLKVLDSKLMHKSDIGGVSLFNDRQSIGQALTAMRGSVAKHTKTEPSAFLVEEMVAGGYEIILGANRDELGVSILLGAGGVAAELYKDTTIRLLENGKGLTLKQAEEMMRDLVAWPLLDGYRGADLRDTKALAEVIVNFSEFIASLGDELVTAEINPLFVLKAGAGVVAADAVLVLNERS
ncbi:acetate--CoA ligase family protein [Vibrio ostreae]|uniref:Acetate--CoA ligase family protein n=1 Tax=Vibrio ostreae TaxID=2841925 RepID=A0A975YMT7_9VIBR|nr:acetate--CoA ligase family protein [Vibrio ostreae]QXO17043.1 acetate--CoA ligase family protein [Vibrio ostreae]